MAEERSCENCEYEGWGGPRCTECNFGKALEIEHHKIIPRKVRFYRKDSDGYYYIPEISKPVKEGKKR